MNEVATLPVHSVLRIPRSVRPLLAQVLSGELQHACYDGIWGFLRMYMFAKAVLHAPPRAGKQKRYEVKDILSSRLRQWQECDILSLWNDARIQSTSQRGVHPSSTLSTSNARRSLKLSREGRFADAMRALGSQGCASQDDPAALTEIKSRLPEHSLPVWHDDVPAPLVVDFESVLAALEAFPRGSSPCCSQLRAQHLLDAIKGTGVPEAKFCLDNLTRLASSLLSGKIDRAIAPWLSGAPLTSLHKKSGGYRPIAIGEVIRRLISQLCCASVKSHLPDVFLPYGQVGVGVRGGMEASVHTVRSFIAANSDKADLFCFKLDMRNACNECYRNQFLQRLRCEFPELFAWVQWSYHSAGELRFGDYRIYSWSSAR